QSVTTDSSGVASLSFDSALPPNTGTAFTATATSPANNTSAFSNAVALSGGGTPAGNPSGSTTSSTPTPATTKPTAAQYRAVLVDAFLFVAGTMTGNMASSLVGLGSSQALIHSVPPPVGQQLMQAFLFDAIAFMVMAEG